jgi:hypothetical protein
VPVLDDRSLRAIRSEAIVCEKKAGSRFAQPAREVLPGMVLPNLIGLGAQRAGTTWLYKVLSSHPDVFLSATRKEIHFFDLDYARGLDWYSRFFPSVEEAGAYQWIGEITPMYLFDPRVAQRIRNELPECRFLVSLRQPADRAYSQYGIAVRSSNEQRSFEQYLAEEDDVFARGLYVEQLARYFALFPRERFLVLIFEELTAQPELALKGVAEFLGIDPGGFSAALQSVGKTNESYRPKFARAYAMAHRLGLLLGRYQLDGMINAAKQVGFPALFGRQRESLQLDRELRDRLTARYAADIRQLEDLLDRPLSLWLGRAEDAA